MTCVMTGGWECRTNRAFSGQPCEQVDHNVFAGNACTNGAVPKYRNNHTAKKPTRTTRSTLLSTGPCWKATTSHTTQGETSHVARRPTVNGTLADDVVSAVNDHRNPMPSN